MAPKAGRLYAKAVFTGYKRGLRNQRENTALLKMEGAESKEDARWYIGKRCAYVYRVSVIWRGLRTRVRILWSHDHHFLVAGQEQDVSPQHQEQDAFARHLGQGD